jgi:hypothetical protein
MIFLATIERRYSTLSLDRTTLFCRSAKTFARFPSRLDHGIVIVLSRLPGDTEVKQLAPQITVNKTHQFGQDTSTPLHLPSGWWLAPMLFLGIAMWYWIISGFLSVLN